jgi:aminoglycoside 3-N-acetyltransferase I
VADTLITECLRLRSEDAGIFRDLLVLFGDVFEMDGQRLPAEERLRDLLDNASFDAFTIFAEGELAGGITVYTLEQYYSEKPLAYIYDLAIRSEFQRRGLGKMLIAFVVEHYREMGYADVFVQTDENDAHALDFYRSTHPTDERKVRHFTYSF